MEKLNLKDAVAFGNAAFTRLDRAEALYEQLVERLYALGEDVAAHIESPARVADALIKAAQAVCQILLAGLIPNEELVKERAATKPASPPDITVLAPDLSIYNGLMQSRRL